MKQKLLILPLLSLLLFSCSDEHAPVTPPVPEGYTTVEIFVPGNTTVNSRALDAVDECEVQTMDVLVFDAATDKFLYHTTGESITTPNASTPNIKTFNVGLKQDAATPASIYLMLIANHAVNYAAISPGTSKDDVLRNLILKKTVNGPWPVKPGVFTRFPMWGISSNISTTGALTIPTVTLIRSVAKIDVGIKFNGETAQGLGKVFKLEEIHVYNAHTMQYVAPYPYSNYNELQKKVTAPSVPNPPGTNSGALRYKLRDYNTDKFAHTNEIYVSEHATDAGAPNTNLLLVIGARYGTAAAEGTTMTYYRIDLVKSGTPLPILRNHRYKVNITAVHGPGAATAAAALSGPASNLEVEITDTDEGVTQIVTDGHYMLGVNKSHFVIDKTEHSNASLVPIEITTTNPQGWTVTPGPGSSWITFPGGQSQAGPGKSTLRFGANANTGGAERTGTFIIKATSRSNLQQVVTIVQRSTAAIEVVGKQDIYVMIGPNYQTHNFTLKSAFDWQVKIKDDPHNILRTFDTSGTPNTVSAFNFVLGNDGVMDATATLTFYSLTDAFAPVDVSLRGVSYFDLGGVYVYPIDQPAGQNWYTYANVPDGVNGFDVPPLGPQNASPVTHSCAAIVPQFPGKPWRLPTNAELEAVIQASWEGSAAAQTNQAKYGFMWLKAYWSATMLPSYANTTYIRYSSNALQYTSHKTNATNRARCVRSK